MPLSFSPFHSRLCFSSFPPILSVIPLQPRITMTDPWLCSQDESSQGVCGVLCIISLHALVPVYAKPLPSWARHGSEVEMKHLEQKSRSEYVEAEARLPSGRSPTLEYPSITDKHTPHLSFSSSSTRQGHLFVSLQQKRKQRHTLRLSLLSSYFSGISNCSKVSAGVEMKFKV